MVTRKLLFPGLSVAVALSVGLLSQNAAAAEEIVVDGSEAAARAAAEREHFRTEMSEYVKSLNDQIKGRLSELKLLAPKLYLAESETRIRG